MVFLPIYYPNFCCFKVCEKSSMKGVIDLYSLRTVGDLSYFETVNKIVELNEHIRSFWSKSHGWAPIDAANLLSKSRLDWLVLLSHSLYKWGENPGEGAKHGDLILACPILEP